MKYRTLLKRLSKTTTVDALDKRAKVRVMATYYSHDEPHERVVGDALVTTVYAQDSGQPLIIAELDRDRIMANIVGPHLTIGDDPRMDIGRQSLKLLLNLATEARDAAEQNERAALREGDHDRARQHRVARNHAARAVDALRRHAITHQWLTPLPDDQVTSAASSEPSQVINEEEAELRAAFDALVAQGAHESNDGFRLLRRARQLSLDGLASDIKLWLMYAPVEDNPQTGDAS